MLENDSWQGSWPWSTLLKHWNFFGWCHWCAWFSMFNLCTSWNHGISGFPNKMKLLLGGKILVAAHFLRHNPVWNQWPLLPRPSHKTKSHDKSLLSLKDSFTNLSYLFLPDRWIRCCSRPWIDLTKSYPTRLIWNQKKVKILKDLTWWNFIWKIPKVS